MEIFAWSLFILGLLGLGGSLGYLISNNRTKIISDNQAIKEKENELNKKNPDTIIDMLDDSIDILRTISSGQDTFINRAEQIIQRFGRKGTDSVIDNRKPESDRTNKQGGN